MITVQCTEWLSWVNIRIIIIIRTLCAAPNHLLFSVWLTEKTALVDWSIVEQNREPEREPIRRSVYTKLVILLREPSRLRRQDQKISFASY